uniref:Uncharacterized protein n=1 Tax=Zea mays TaxID=4577 RepID=B6TEW9_MAIZE|nr:hypothetical protein [Zea mays]
MAISRRSGGTTAIPPFIVAWPVVISTAARGHVSSEMQVGNWNLKCQVKNRYHRMRRLEDAAMCS